MKRIAGFLLLMTLLTFPVHAIGPVAIMAKELVKGIVRNYIEGNASQLFASDGPCGLPIAGAGGITGMLGGRGPMPGLSLMRGVGMIPLPDNADISKGALPVMPGMSGGLAMPPGMEEMMHGQMEQALAMMAKEQAKNGADLQDKENLGTPETVPDMAKAMQAMQNETPLTSAEIEELGSLLEQMSTAIPSATHRCKPGEMKAILQQASLSPMGSGVLRLMLESMRDMQNNLDQARDTFAKMTESERSEYVESMHAESRSWDRENRVALRGMIETNFLGMPDSMRKQLLARLGQTQ